MTDKNDEFHQEQEKRLAKIRKSANRDKQIAKQLRRQGNQAGADRKMRDYDHAVSLLKAGIGATQPTLSNVLLTALANPKRGIYGYQQGKYAEAMRRSVQANIATSQKFVVSNSLVEHAYLASLAKPQTLVNMLERAKPCFSNMWIEWDEDFRQDIINREMKKAGLPHDESKADVADRIGYHIMEINGQPMFTNYMVVRDDFDETKNVKGPKADQVVGMPIGFYMSSDGPFTHHELDGKFETYPSDDQAFEMDMEMTSSALMGAWYLDGWEKKGKMDAALKGCFIQVQSAPMHWAVPSAKFDQGWTPREMTEYKARALMSQAGDGRFLIALLGLLNYDLIAHETVQPAKQIDQIKFGRKVPKNEYKVVTINLPKPRGKRIYDQMFTGHGTPKREHWRRGHWRTLKDARGNVKKRVWIGEMKVGDPALGTIIHDYEFKSKSS